MGRRVIFYNESFFSEWNKHNAHVFGAFAADGNIYESKDGKSHEWKITMHADDEEFLYKILELMECTPKLYKDRSTKSIRITGLHLYNEMLRLGATPRKSLTMGFPVIPKEYLRYFVLGVFEGDGNIRVRPRKRSPKPTVNVSIVSGSREFAYGLLAAVTEAGVTGGYVYEEHSKKTGNTYYRILFNQEHADSFLDFIYSDSEVVMARKYESYIASKGAS